MPFKVILLKFQSSPSFEHISNTDLTVSEPDKGKGRETKPSESSSDSASDERSIFHLESNLENEDNI
jgi:hypothetical protein